MESTPGEVSGNTEDVTERKKSKFKFLKVRLFWRLKKKDSEVRMKQSQSAGDVTAPEGERGKDDFHYPEGTLSSRALSHDSIFLADQVQSSQPTRVLSQENVHSKIKSLQVKLQQQNMPLATPLLIPGKRVEDSGATSEDDGLPRSPPEMSLQEVSMHSGASKCPEAKKHLSCLSLAGTGSEEEEQGGFSQPSSRPLSPVPQAESPPVESPFAVVDFTRPAQYVPILDNSAARHRMSIRPRNQRASTKGKKNPDLYHPRSSSMNSLDEQLPEQEETMQLMHHYSYISEGSTQAEDPVILPSSVNLWEEPEKVTSIDGSLWNPSKSQTTELSGNKDRTNTASLVSSDDIIASNHIKEPLAKEHLNAQYTDKIKVNEEHQASTSLTPLCISPVDIASDYNVIKETTDYSLAASSTDEMETLKTAIDENVSKSAEAITRPHPVPAPRTKKPTLSNINNSPPKVSSEKPTDPEKETASSLGLAEPSKEDDKPQRPSSFRFNIASAKYRSKTSDENVARQNGETSGNPQKGQAYNQNSVVQMGKAEATKSTEVCRNIPSAPEKRSTLWKDVISQYVSKTLECNNLEKSEGCLQNTEYRKSEKAEDSEDRRGLFGVKLRSTSLTYCSDMPKSEAEMKRHSLESHHILTGKEPVSSDMEAADNDRKANVLTDPAPQSVDSQQDPTLDKESRPEPAWRILAREKTKVHQSFSMKLSTHPASPSASTTSSTPQSSFTQQLSKPSLQPRPHLPPTSKPQPVNQSSQQIPPRAAPRAIDKRTTSNQREEKCSVSPSTHRDELMDFRAQSKPGAKSTTQTEHDQLSPSDKAQPTWMELAKRKSLAWSDKTLDSMNF